MPALQLAGGSPSSSPKSKSDGHHACGCGGSEPKACHCHDQQPGVESTTTGPTNGELSLADFARMTQAEKLAYNKAKRDRIFG